MALIHELQSRIEKENLSLREVAKLSGVSPSTLSRALRGIGEISRQTERGIEAWMQGREMEPQSLLFSKIIELNGKQFRLILEEL